MTHHNEGDSMLTRTQTDAIREHVALSEPTLRLIRLANTDLYEGPGIISTDEDDHDAWPGFAAACEMIREAIPRSDLYLDLDCDEVIGDVEPDDSERVLCVDHRHVVSVLVGRELSRHV